MPTSGGRSDGTGRVALIPWLAYAALGFSMALIGAYVGLSKLLLAVFPVFLLAWLRFAIAAVAMLSWQRRPADELPLPSGDRKLLFLCSLLGNFGFSVCMLLGVAWSSAISAGVVMAALPSAVALLSWRWLGERIGRRMQLAIVCAGLGIGVMALARAPAGPAGAAGALDAPDAKLWAGHALLLGAVFCEASFVVIGKRLSGSLSPRRISALINLWGLALMTPLGLWQATQFDFHAVSAAQWLGLVAFSLTASMFSVWLWMKGLAQVPAPRAGVFTVMLPVSAASMGVLFLGEAFGAWHGLALLFALAGLLLATWPEPVSNGVTR